MKLNYVDYVCFFVHRLLLKLVIFLKSLDNGDDELKDDIELIGLIEQSQMRPEDYPPEVLKQIIEEVRKILLLVILVFIIIKLFGLF